MLFQSHPTYGKLVFFFYHLIDARLQTADDHFKNDYLGFYCSHINQNVAHHCHITRRAWWNIFYMLLVKDVGVYSHSSVQGDFFFLFFSFYRNVLFLLLQVRKSTAGLH